MLYSHMPSKATNGSEKDIDSIHSSSILWTGYTYKNEQLMTWTEELKHAIREPQQLAKILSLDNMCGNTALQAHEQFPLFVTRPYLNRIEPGNPRDPLLLQILPQSQECLPPPATFSPDPLHEADAQVAPGLLHKYAHRVLMILAGSCPINCRYCFRRHFPYKEHLSIASRWQPALEYIRQHTDIREVILSGGEPLLLSDDLMAQLFEQLDAIDHIQCIRIHTRMPIVIPSRITSEFLALCQDSRCKMVMVIHSNHAHELDSEVKAALQLCHKHDITLLNQSVLLRHVNDNATTLIELSHTLFDANVLPYYLHLLDKVKGAQHFEVPMATAQHIMRQMAAQLPGYLVPRLAQEQPHHPNKTLIDCNQPTTIDK